ncbi:MAG: polysaccharide biosynthesis C-terminal domain-containing protein [Tannerella sp.]|nr:polysaccharide biosynthesis C-terminal domain-containing protein [Tannerella sp.]
MWKDLIGTVGARYLIAFFNLALIFVNARVLGVRGMGEIGLIWASVSICATVNGLLGGNTLTYFVHKYALRTLYPIAAAWILAGSALSCACLHLLGMLPEGYGWAIFLLSVLYSFPLAHARLLLGIDDIFGFNLTNILQGGLLFFVLCAFYYIIGIREVQAYIWGQGLVNGLAFLWSLHRLHTRRGEGGKQGRLPVLKEMLSYGLWGSADNLAEVLATRLNYFLVQSWLGLGAVGLLDAATKLSESIWNISRGAASVEYNRMVRIDEADQQRRVTLRLLKFSTLAVAAAVLLLCLLPEQLFTGYLFGKHFAGIRPLILLMAPGVVCYAANNILSAYFIGTGRIRYSTFVSFAGLLVLLAAASCLIPLWGLPGSALAGSLSYAALLLAALFFFRRKVLLLQHREGST